jgi:hypothetical protein
MRPGITAQLQAGDAEVVQEPTDQTYGIYDGASRDPAGNVIRIQELHRAARRSYPKSSDPG